MRFQRVRSGLAETTHDVAVIALDAGGHELLASGDVERPFFYRSAVKPFQALASLRHGLDVPAEHLAITCSSHSGYPVHLQIVEAILAAHGLDGSHLACPPSWPLGQPARDALFAAGYRRPEPLFHNCSGKHAGWLAASAVAGFPTDGYLDIDHPIQQTVRSTVAEFTGSDPEPVGVDGCGAPTLVGTVRSLARGFARLTTDPEIRPIADAMTAYGALVADNVRPDGRFGIAWGGPSKTGAEGIFAASRNGLAIAAKAAGGDSAIAAAAVVEAARRLGALDHGALTRLDDIAHPAVLGGGRPVGRLELAGSA